MATKLLMTTNFHEDMVSKKAVYGFWIYYSITQKPSLDDFKNPERQQEYFNDMQYLDTAGFTNLDNRILLINLGFITPSSVLSYAICYSTEKIYNEDELLSKPDTLKFALYTPVGDGDEELTLVSGARNNLYLNIEKEPVFARFVTADANNVTTHEHELMYLRDPGRSTDDQENPPDEERYRTSTENTAYAVDWMDKVVDKYTAVDTISDTTNKDVDLDEDTYLRTEKFNYKKANDLVLSEAEFNRYLPGKLSIFRSAKNTNEQYFFKNAKLKLLGDNIGNGTSDSYSYIVDNDNKLYKVRTDVILQYLSESGV